MTHLVLTDSLRRAERLFGRKQAIICGDGSEANRFTYAELGSRCRRLITVLHERGVARGDRVAVLMPNCHRYLEAYFAIPGMGAVIVPLNTRHTADEHRTTLDDCGARLVIADASFEDAIGALASPQREFLIAPREFEGLLASSEEAEPDSAVEEDDLAALFYTGGTTGEAKGVMLSHRNLVANAFNITIEFGYRPSDVLLHVAPMFHLADAGSIHAVTWQGGSHTFLPAFDPAAIFARIAAERVTCMLGVPTMIQMLARHPDAASTDLSSLRLIAHGGAPISAALLKAATDVFPCSFTQAYGLTESSSFAAVLPNEERLLDDDRLLSAGRAATGVELAVRRPDGTVCAPDEIGEITGRGPNFTKGYWNRPDATAEAIRDGWFWTGDIGRMDEDGYLYIVDRAKDMIISGGENVYSIEVEAAIAQHPAVLEAAVIGLPDEIWGERVHAIIVAKPNQAVDADDLLAFCKDRLAGYKCPRSADLVDSLPKSGAGKILKRLVRDEYRTREKEPIS